MRTSSGGILVQPKQRTYNKSINRVFIWTDGSKTKEGVGCSVFFKQKSLSTLPQTTSISEAELIAAETAIMHGP